MVDTEDVMAMAFDTPIPGYGNNTVNTSAPLVRQVEPRIRPQVFNEGNYIRAVEKKMTTENISKVLYPADNVLEGKELRFKQEYSSPPLQSTTSSTVSRKSTTT